MPPSLLIDLVSDLARIWTQRLASMSVPLPVTKDPAQVGAVYFQHLRKRIETRPRRFLESAELATQIQKLSQPLADGFDAIRLDVEAGNDLTKYMSRAWDDSERPDGMYLEWNIHHFHLGGPNVQADGHVPRTSDLLFCIVTGDGVYGIQISTHKGSFSRQAIFDIAYKNWPSVFDRSKIPFASGLSHIPTDEERNALRKSNINVLTVAPDGAVCAPSAGRMSSGLDAVAMRESLKWTKAARDIESEIRVNIKSIRSKVFGDNERMDLNVALRENGHTIEVVELNSNNVLFTITE
jgi:hypothetical protein